MTAKEFNTLIDALRGEADGIDGFELVIREHDIRVLCDDTDDEFEVGDFAQLKKLINAINTIKLYKA
jgi:hypothetical protein